MTTEAELIQAWEAANKVWQADVFNKEKEKTLEDARWALHSWRRWNTPEGRAYAESPKTYKDETGDNAPDDDEA